MVLKSKHTHEESVQHNPAVVAGGGGGEGKGGGSAGSPRFKGAKSTSIKTLCLLKDGAKQSNGVLFLPVGKKTETSGRQTPADCDCVSL